MFDDIRNKKILITGSAGFIGTNLLKRLLEIESISIRATIHKKQPPILDKRIEYIECDLTNMGDCRRAVEGIDYVFMCAASTAGAAVMAATPLVHVTPNIIMNSQMLEAAYFAKVKKFIWLSSNAAYPPSDSRPVKEEEMFNGDPYDTYFGVGWMKRYTELLCRLYSEKLKECMVTVVLRPSNIYGPYDKYDFGTSHMMAATIRKVIERHKPIKVWGTGDDVRDLIYIDDFIDAMLLAAERIDKYNPINIAYGRGYTVKEILQYCLKIDGFSDAVIEYDTSKPSMIPVRLISTEKAEKVLGFKACTDLQEGIKKTMEWYRQNANIEV